VTQTYLRTFLPALVSFVLAFVAFVLIGQTPWIRAVGLALVIAAMALTLRRLSAGVSVAGSLSLAFSPAFWSQTGGPESGPPVMALLLFGVVGVGLLLQRYQLRAFWLIQVCILVATIVLWREFTEYRSLRITTLCATLILYLLIDGLLRTNPRPNMPAEPLDVFHTLGLLLLLTVGIINEPLMTLFAPAILLGVVLSRAQVHLSVWGVFMAMIAFGVYRIVAVYVSPEWWSYSAVAAQTEGVQLPVLIGDGWRSAARWVELLQLLGTQFTLIGAGLSVIGLARLSRWYPPLGTVTLLGFATFAVFGLVYFGADRTVLLLPLLMIMMVWISYAVYALGEWLQKISGRPITRWVAAGAFALMPLFLLAQIIRP
jgi:hypothetical protein